MQRVSSVRRVFLSYSSDDRAEVQSLYTELRRRGVPVWFDTADLPRGRVTKTELARAGREAVGFAFYLTESAAESSWVREDERSHALENQREDESFGIFPIFRGGLDRVTEIMQARAEDRSGLASYDLRPFHGFVISEDLDPESLAEELRAAATGVLRSLLGTLAERRPAESSLRIGCATREGPKLTEHPLDLLVEWSQDFPDEHGGGSYPDARAATDLLGALQDLRRAISSEWRGLKVEIVPQCHLSMAVAMGFLFRRNSGFTLEVVNPYTREVWPGPDQPLAPLAGFWSITEVPELSTGSNEGLVVALGVSRSIVPAVKDAVTRHAIEARAGFGIEPSAGASLESMKPSDAAEPHRAARALFDWLSDQRASGVRGRIHLFYAGPAPFAVLLGQQLSNVGEVQFYEWKDSAEGFVPVFLLKSS